MRNDIKKIQAACGQDKLNVEVDCRYSNPIHASTGNTPFQAATQMTQLVAENLTASKIKMPSGTVVVTLQLVIKQNSIQKT